MPSALYYPHTYISDVALVKNALLLWDSIRYIVPNEPINRPRFDKNHERALEIVGKPHKPSNAEKKETHKKIEIFLQKGLPRQFYQLDPRVLRHRHHSRSIDEIPGYLIYPDKFEESTWRLLREYGLAESMFGDYNVPPAFGLLIMSLLADSCAGSQILKVTDRTEAYTWIAENQTNELGGQYLQGIDASAVASNYDRLITLSIKILDTSNISMEKLISFRERELRSSNSSDYKKFRDNYFEAINRYIKRLGTEVRNDSDIREIETQFEIEMRNDLKDLKSELNLSVSDALLSKEVLVSIMAAAGTYIPAILGMPYIAGGLDVVGVGALIQTSNKYTKARKDALKSHPMSWLYLNQTTPKFMT